MYSLTEQELDEKVARARDIVKKKARFSGLAAVFPLPFLDIGTDVKFMTEIEDEINTVFGITADDLKEKNNSFKTRFAIMLSSGVGEIIAKYSSKIVLKILTKITKKEKIGPLYFSTIITHLANGTVSYFLMKKLGDDHIDHVVRYFNRQTVE